MKLDDEVRSILDDHAECEIDSDSPLDCLAEIRERLTAAMATAQPPLHEAIAMVLWAMLVAGFAFLIVLAACYG